ncbi:MAG: SUMF1/EgtB/PvdO family nonheme iron enzyme [Verrucomicrobiales bacterium]|nr:SUMF1/EgtB/PvdO family nonheme iron enzyme [Verrucomicrobiales bacterium]MCP5560844.1 SUMF1/EgtB/PvdO family nonheme iron enzyme [Verrucomicrobiaceae bacterium]
MKPTFAILLGLAATTTLLLSHCATTTGSGGGGSGGLPPATKESPFVNSLGMKFVPVPGTKILMCTTETTVAQYQAAGMGYEPPKFSQGSDHPAVNVSWDDAKAWCAWLSKKEGRKYRLPTDAEWSAAVGRSAYPWGNQWPPPSNCGNYAGQEMRGCTAAEREILFEGFGIIGSFSDRHKFTGPVGSYPANGLGLYDLGGNVWEWCEDWHPKYRGEHHVLRGGSWSYDNRKDLASSSQHFYPPGILGGYGFRCVVERRDSAR